MNPAVSNGAALVSTIIPVRNRATFLRAAVESVLAQSHPSVEVMIVDDGSTDNTVALADALAAEHPATVRVLHNPSRGPGPAREAGRLEARGAYLQYLDSDDRLLPDKFALQVAALEARPDADIAYGTTRLIDEDGRTVVDAFKWTDRKAERLFPWLLVDRWWCTHTPLYRRSLCDRIGPWTDLRYSQDWEYDARAGALGARLVRVAAVVSEHRHHEGLRQTGGGRWLTPPDQVRFFQLLLACAQEAGVPVNSPELRHFSRWVFAAARAAGAARDNVAATQLIQLAKSTCVGRPMDMQIYELAVRCMGWRLPWYLFVGVNGLLRRNRGAASLPQSWEGSD